MSRAILPRSPVPRADWFRLALRVVGVVLVGVTGAEAASGTVLRASDAALYDAMGSGVAVSGDYAVLGAPNDTIAGAVNVGSAYVFRKTASGWVQQRKLVASDGTAYDKFGSSVAIDGDFVVVGAVYDADRGTNSGSVYIFHRNDHGTPTNPADDSWDQRQKLLLPDGAAHDYFGTSVGVSGTTLIVGSSQGNPSFAYGNGAAYVYRFNGTSWVQDGQLVASDGAFGDRFGAAVAVSGDVALIGAYLDQDPAHGTGSAYVFRKSGSTWVQSQKLFPSGPGPYTQFGTSVALYGDLAVIGDPFDDDRGDNFGSATVFRFNGSTWSRETELYGSDATTNERFGAAVAAGDNTVVVGAYNEGSSGALSMDGYGAAYRFTKQGSGWAEEEKLEAAGGARLDSFGQSVGLSGAVVVIGAPGFSEDAYKAGAGYAYASGCAADADCNDGNPCTTDRCDGGACSYVNNTASCNDGDACTSADRCGNGVCSGTPMNCDDGVSCTVDSCVSGTCQHDDANCECAVNADCDDGNACTTDSCVGGSCQHGNAGCECTVNADCDDDNPCTTDTCASGSCSHANNSDYCDDGDACTSDDRCSGGACSGTPIDCDDGVGCTVDSCVGGTCRHDDTSCQCAADTDCDDGYACTIDSCVGGVCQHDDAKCECTANTDCNDGNPCTTATCDSGTCGYVNNNDACDDGDACTTDDRCSGGACFGTAMDCDDGVSCTVDSCVSGTCRHNDANCTCVVNADCDDGNPCTTDSCVRGGCSHVDNTNACNDGDTCTTDDQCFGGACSGTAMDCDDGVSCTADSCVSGACRHDDANCTCAVDMDCDDGDPCTNDTCVGGACGHFNNSDPCDDGDACTTDDRCSDGTCTGTPVNCDNVTPEPAIPGPSMCGAGAMGAVVAIMLCLPMLSALPPTRRR